MSREQLLADLEALDALFADEGRWTQFAFARDERGTPVPATSARARCWCLAGATRIACRNPDGVRLALLNTPLVYGWNDDTERTFSDIKSLIARTKERVQQELQS